MPLTTHPQTVQKDSTFEFWRQQTNILSTVVNTILTGGVFNFDSAVLTQVDIDGGTIDNVTVGTSMINDSVINEPTIDNATITYSDISTSIITNSEIETTDITSPGIKGTWDFNTYTATLNIATGTSAQLVSKGLGGQAELFWNTTTQTLKILDNTTVGGKTVAKGASITEWQSGAIYQENDLVSDEGGVYVSLINNNENIKPSTDLGFDSWEVVNRSYVDDTATALAIALG